MYISFARYCLVYITVALLFACKKYFLSDLKYVQNSSYMYFEYILHWIAPLALEMRIIICFAQTRDCHVLFFRAQNKKYI